MRYCLILLGLLVANVANAIDCQKLPSCEELGYSKEDVKGCADNGYLTCPFDETYKKCVTYDCEALGFTESDKSSWCKDIVKCSSNEQYTACAYACMQPPAEPCEVGSVYYANGTCSSVENYEGCGTPVGVVFYASDGHGKVINLHDLGKEAADKPFNPEYPYDSRYTYFFWGYYGYNVPNLQDYSKSTIVSNLKAYDSGLYDGKGNTEKILKAEKPACSCDESSLCYYQKCIPEAAKAAHDFYPPEVSPDDPIVGQGNWYLPAFGEQIEMYGYDNSKITHYYQTSGANGNTKNIINATFKALKDKGVEAEELTENYYWPSTEADSTISWLVSMHDGYRSDAYKNSTAGYRIRACLEF